MPTTTTGDEPADEARAGEARADEARAEKVVADEPAAGEGEAPRPDRELSARRLPPLLVTAAVTVGAALVALAVAAVLTSSGGTDGGTDGGTAAGDGAWHGTVLGEARPRPAFTLTDTSGEPYDFAARTDGELTLLFFGYTSCPDICPIQMATLSSALDQPGMPEATVVFVTTDPARDTPERLRSWLDGFGADIVGLTGTPEQVTAAEQAAGVAASTPVGPDGAPAASPGADDYEVAHASHVVAYAADDVARLVYPAGVPRDAWAADLPRLAAGEAPAPPA